MIFLHYVINIIFVSMLLLTNIIRVDADTIISPIIIPREVWGADPLYNTRTSEYWKNILKNREEKYQESLIESNSEDQKAQKKKNQEIQDYLYGNFLYQFTLDQTLVYHPETQQHLAWPLQYTNEVDAIIIHHTHSEYQDSIKGMQNIHTYHSLNREWGDIGYHYIIGYNGEIFEGREGGHYVRGAHSKYNNFGTVSIAVMGNYHSEGVNNQQYQSLDTLVKYLTYTYGIDLGNTRYYHRACAGKKCDTFHIETYLDSVMIGHRDASHTDCPGDKLYEQIQEIRENNLDFTYGFTAKKRDNILEKEPHKEVMFEASIMHRIRKEVRKYDSEILLQLKKKLEILIKNETHNKKKKQMQILELAILLET